MYIVCALICSVNGICEDCVLHCVPSSLRLTPSAFAWYTSFLFKAFPLDMSQYGNLFNATRVPRLEKDELVTYDSGGNHAVVLRKGHFYKFTVVNEDGEITYAYIQQ